MEESLLLFDIKLLLPFVLLPLYDIDLHIECNTASPQIVLMML